MFGTRLFRSDGSGSIHAHDGFQQRVQTFNFRACLAIRSRHVVHHALALPHQCHHVDSFCLASKLHATIDKLVNVKLPTTVSVQRLEHMKCIPDFQAKVREDARAVLDKMSLELVKSHHAVAVEIYFVKEGPQTLYALLFLVLLKPHDDVAVHLRDFHSIIHEDTSDNVEKSQEHYRDVEQEQHTILQANIQKNPLCLPPVHTTSDGHEHRQDTHGQRMEKLI
mmetsp:Transcript_48961/g.129715  ORF Transcript_48961/g.129715 Transcript_48961/m.129715 type:complete len:223 (-) Transcript_48961:223-891(-)